MEKYLPIGTVVLLKGGKKEVMITSYCIFPNNLESSKDKKFYEYGGCVYPEGILDTMVCAFNHNQIEKISYLGYQSEQQEALSQILNDGLNGYKNTFDTAATEVV